MRYILSLIAIVLIFSACKKDKFTTVPQISFKAFRPNSYSGVPAPQDMPVMTVHVTDLEGDLGFVAGKDTAFLYIKNLRTNFSDSVMLPVLGTAAKSNFEADIDVNLNHFIIIPTKNDTIYFQVYLKDFAKNQSNVITTDKPLYYFK